MKLVCEFPCEGTYRVIGSFTLVGDNGIYDMYTSEVYVGEGGTYEVDLRTGDSEMLTPCRHSPEIKNNIEVEEKTCNHKWKWYNGISNNFEYCEVCDAKK